jgi:hypothetical protein
VLCTFLWISAKGRGATYVAAESGHDFEELVAGLDDLGEVFGVEDFFADFGGGLGDGDDGDAFPGSMGRPGGDAGGVGGGGEQVVEAIFEVGGEAEFEAAGVFFGLELKEVEEAFGGRIVGWMDFWIVGRGAVARFALARQG